MIDFGLWASVRGFERQELSIKQLTSLQGIWREWLLSPAMESEVLELLTRFQEHGLIEKIEGKWRLTGVGKAAVEEMVRTPINPGEDALEFPD